MCGLNSSFKDCVQQKRYRKILCLGDILNTPSVKACSQDYFSLYAEKTFYEFTFSHHKAVKKY
jgi:hypothetical protein